MAEKEVGTVNMYDGKEHELRYGTNHGGYATPMHLDAPAHQRRYIKRPFEAFFDDYEFLQKLGFGVELVAPGVIRATYQQAT